MNASIQTNIKNLSNQIAACEQRYQRPKNSVRLLAVSKTKSVKMIQEAMAAGLTSFAENYLQEALPKIQALAHSALEWHYIGNIQSNKTNAIAQNFAWVHSIDSVHIAARLNAQRPENMPPLNCLIQVNIDDETTKKGVSTAEIYSLASEFSRLPHLHLRGLMAIPRAETDFAMQRHAFNKMNQLFIRLQQQGLGLDTLSMGMSHDFEAAIAEGATLIRIGTALFGPR